MDLMAGLEFGDAGREARSNVMEYDRHGGGSVFIWGGISYN